MSVAEPDGVFVTGTDTEVGKTVIAGAIALLLRRAGRRVGVFKPVATGCRHDPRGDLVSADAEFLAHCADSPADLPTINPVRYADALAPSVAARRAKRPVDFEAIDRAYRRIRQDRDVVVVEGIGGLMVPLDERTFVTDLAKRLRLPLVVVARAGLGTINHTLLTLDAARRAGLDIAGVFLNHYRPSEATLAEETNPDEIARCGNVDLPTVVPHDPAVHIAKGLLGDDLLFAVSQWGGLTRLTGGPTRRR